MPTLKTNLLAKLLQKEELGKKYRTWYKVDFPTYKKILKWYKRYYLPSRIQPLECEIIEKKKAPIQIISVVRKRIYGKLGWEKVKENIY